MASWGQVRDEACGLRFVQSPENCCSNLSGALPKQRTSEGDDMRSGVFVTVTVSSDVMSDDNPHIDIGR